MPLFSTLILKSDSIYKMSDMVSCHLNKFLKICSNFDTI